MWLKLLPARLYARLLDFDANRTDLISLVKAYGIAHLSHIFLFELSVVRPHVRLTQTTPVRLLGILPPAISSHSCTTCLHSACSRLPC